MLCTKYRPADMAVARTYFSRAIELDAGFGAAYCSMAVTFLAEGSHFLTISFAESVQQSELLLLKALALDGTDPNARSMLAGCIFLTGDFALALREVELALLTDPNCAEGHGIRGIVLVNNGQDNEGQEALRTAIRLDPLHPRSAARRSFIAYSQYQQNDYEGAIETARHVVREFPTFPPAYRWLAAALGQLGKTDEAAEALKTLIELAPSNIEVFLKGKPAWMLADRHAHMLDGLRKAAWKG
jgi:adenylate cyclase